MKVLLKLFVALLIVSFCCVPNLVAQDTLTEEQAKEAQKKLVEALSAIIPLGGLI